jgi:hypothetical protein
VKIAPVSQAEVGPRVAAAPPSDAPLCARKPMVRALRVSLLDREIKERLSASAIDILLDRARVISEGRRATAPTAGAAFFGSTMFTIDLTSCADDVRERCDPPLARRLAAFMTSDRRVLERVRRTAEREAERLAGGPVAARAADVRVRAQGVLLHIDVDVEGPRRAV